jgi:hypothetical protein
LPKFPARFLAAATIPFVKFGLCFADAFTISRASLFDRTPQMFLRSNFLGLLLIDARTALAPLLITINSFSF